MEIKVDRAMIVGEVDRAGNLVPDASLRSMAKNAVGKPVHDTLGREIGTITSARVENDRLVVEIDCGVNFGAIGDAARSFSWSLRLSKHDVLGAHELDLRGGSLRPAPERARLDVEVPRDPEPLINDLNHRVHRPD